MTTGIRKVTSRCTSGAENRRVACLGRARRRSLQVVAAVSALVLPSGAAAKAKAMMIYYFVAPTAILGLTIAAAWMAHRCLVPRRRWMAYGWIFAVLWVPVPIGHEYYTAGLVWEVALTGDKIISWANKGDLLFACLCMLLTGMTLSFVAYLAVPACAADEQTRQNQHAGENEKPD